MENKPSKKGLLIVFEGLDRCGKSTQAHMLYNKLLFNGINSEIIKFPDRTTVVGNVIDSYLQNAVNATDQVIHLLFSANRWELKDTINRYITEGKIVIVDRYIYSGIAYSVAKGLDFDWCKACDEGLPEPDLIFYLEMTVDKLMKRGNFGLERYEKKELLERVAKSYERVWENKKLPLVIINGDNDKNELYEIILSIVQKQI